MFYINEILESEYLGGSLFSVAYSINNREMWLIETN